MKNQSLFALALVAGLSAPAFAQDGFRVGVQFGSMKTTGDPATFGFTQQPAGSTTTLNFMNFDQPTQSPLSLDLAWIKGDDEWSLVYTTTKKTTSKTVIDPANGVGIGIIFGSNAGLTGSRELKATILDLAWKRTLVKGDKGSFAFSTGLRLSNQSDERSYQQLDAGGNPNGTYFHMKGKGTGFGLTAGLHGRMTFTDRMWLTTGFTAAMINNSDKTDDYTIGSFGSPNTTVLKSDDVRKSLLQTDAYLRFNMAFVSTFNGYLGYEVRDFNSDAAKVNNIYTGLGAPSTSGFGLAGFSLGLSYTF